MFLIIYVDICLFVCFRSWATTSHEVKLRTKMTDFTYGTCFTLKCKAFGAPTAQELSELAKAAQKARPFRFQVVLRLIYTARS